MDLSTNTTFSFSGHETFPFRYAWLKKGVDAVKRDPSFFAHEKAMVELGVGKNMVRSLRHWCLATCILHEKQRGALTVTELGDMLFADNGADPYLEDPATLWIVHWQIASNTAMATTWFWAFNFLNATAFTKDRLVSGITSWLEKCGAKAVSGNSMRRDVDCFVRTYVHSRQSKSVILEDTLDCPLVDLRLLTELADGRTYQFQRGAQNSLPDEVFFYALVDYWRRVNLSTDTMTLEKIAYAPGSPGRVFKLDEDSLISRLEHIEKVTKGALTFDETAGLKQVYRRFDRDVAPRELLESYYRQHC